jgi:hypothetical protein
MVRLGVMELWASGIVLMEGVLRGWRVDCLFPGRILL